MRRAAVLRCATGLLSGVLLTGVLVAVTAAPAAARQIDNAPLIQWGYTDSRNPTASYLAPFTEDVPLGAWQDSDQKVHMSEIYATFDIAAFAGEHILKASFFGTDTRPTKCAGRQVEIWLTDGKPSRPTWENAPREIRKLGTVGGSTFCPSDLFLDLTDVITEAAAHGWSRLPIELRVPHAVGHDVDFGRRISWFRAIQLSVTYNTGPATPTVLANDFQPCATAAPYPYLPLTPALGAQVHDPDEHDINIDAEFA